MPDEGLGEIHTAHRTTTSARRPTIGSRGLSVLATAVLAAVGCGIALAGSSQTAPPEPMVRVSATGNDATCTRGRNTPPCLTWARAYAIAQPNDLISVAGGTYPGDYLTGNKPVTFQTATGQSVVMTSRFTADNLFNVTFKGPVRVTGDVNVDLMVDGCGSNLVFESWSGNVMAIIGGNSNITIRGGDWGGYTIPRGDSGITGLDRSCGSAIVRNVLIDRVRFHDVLYGPESTWGGAHPDCFETSGNVDGITIRNSIFERCGNTFIGFYTDFGDIRNVTIENNLFRNIGPSTFWSAQVGVNAEGRQCSGFVFRYNTYDPNNPDASEPNPPPLFTCPGARIYGNIFRKGPGPQGDQGRACQALGQIWSYNVFETPRSACGSKAKVVRDAKFVARGTNYHLLADSPAIGWGDPKSFPGRDVDGQKRPVDKAPDAGYDEAPPKPKPKPKPKKKKKKRTPAR
jgi:hypothetical protein